MKFVETVVLGGLVVVLGACGLMAVLPDLLPYLVALFVMALVARITWFYTRGW